MPDAIDTTTMPGDNVFPQEIITAAADIRVTGSQVSSQGTTVLHAWQKLAPDYQAPESGTLLAAMAPAQAAGATFASQLDKTATALEVFAAEATAIKKTVASLRAEANAFLVDIRDGVEKATPQVHGETMTQTVSWDEDQASVDKNNALIGKVDDQQELLWAAERKCANAIYDLTGHAHVEVASDSNPNGYGVTDIPGSADMPWGHTVKRTENCGEKTADAVGHFVVGGLINGTIGGAFQGVGGLLGLQFPSWDPRTWGWSASTFVNSWKGVAMLANAANPTTFVLALAGDKYSQDSYKAVWGAVKSVVAADKWHDDPAAAAGETLGNVALLFVGVGEASAAAKGVGAAGKAGVDASKAAAALRVGSKVAEFTDPVALALKAAKFAGKGAGFSVDALSTLFKNMDFADAADLGIKTDKIDIDLSSVERDSTSVDQPNTHTQPSEVPPVRDQPQDRADSPATQTEREPVTVGGGRHESGATTTHTDRGSDTSSGGGDRTSSGGGDRSTGGGGSSSRDGSSTGGGSDSVPTDRGEPNGPGESSPQDRQPTSADRPQDTSPAPTEVARPDPKSPSEHAGSREGSPEPTGSTSEGKHGAGSDGVPADRGEPNGAGQHSPGDGQPTAPDDRADGSPAAPHTGTEVTHADPTASVEHLGSGDGQPGSTSEGDLGQHDPGDAASDPGAGDHQADTAAPQYDHTGSGDTTLRDVEISRSLDGKTADLLHESIQPDTRYIVDDGKYIFETDNNGRVVYAEGHLTDVVSVEDRVRNSGEQTKAGGEDRLELDDGGHFFATLFDGPAEGVNLTAQDRGLNRGTWKVMENEWAKQLSSGGASEIQVRIDVQYGSDGVRPDRYTVEYSVDGGDFESEIFKNLNPKTGVPSK